MAFEFVKKLFPLKANSLEEFVSTVEREGGVSVVAEPRPNQRNGIYHDTLGGLGDFEFLTQFRSETVTGRPIIFKESYGKIYLGSKAPAHTQKRELYSLRMLLTADRGLRRIKQRLPSIKTELIFKNEAMDEATHRRMYKDAKKYGAVPFD